MKTFREVIVELSKEKLKAYRDEARMAGVPSDKDLKTWGYTADDYGEKAKKHSRGVKTATAKIIQKTKEEDRATKAARQASGQDADKVAAAKARREKWIKDNPDKAKQFKVKNEEVMKTFMEFVELGSQEGTDEMVSATPLMKIEVVKTDDDPHPMANSEKFSLKDELVKRLRGQ